MTKVSRTAGGNADITRILDAVLAAGEADLPMASYGAAVNFRQRCYRFRAALIERAERELADMRARGLAAPGTLPSSPYDSIVILLDKGDTVLRFRQRGDTELLSRLRTPDGAPIELGDEGEEVDASALRRRLGLE